MRYTKPPDMAVAPHAGAWIEIGVKLNTKYTVLVAPHAGAWIEIKQHQPQNKNEESRAPRGRVD